MRHSQAIPKALSSVCLNRLYFINLLESIILLLVLRRIPDLSIEDVSSSKAPDLPPPRYAGAPINF
jgi:hypothetical protein